MIDENPYWRQSKYDFIEDVAEAIEDDDRLKDLIMQMSDLQIWSTYKAFEDPYSDFNITRDYSSLYWERFKDAVNVVRSSADGALRRLW